MNITHTKSQTVHRKRTSAGPNSAEFSTTINLPAAARTKLEGLLNARLADAMDLYSQTKHAHWNVKGANFYSLHLLFDDLAERIEKHIDLFAERVTALGGTAHGTIRRSAAESQLDEFPEDATDGADFVEALVERFSTYANSLRTAIDTASDAGDEGTSDLFTETCRASDEALYFLEAHLRGTDEGRR